MFQVQLSHMESSFSGVNCVMLRLIPCLKLQTRLFVAGLVAGVGGAEVTARGVVLLAFEIQNLLNSSQVMVSQSLGPKEFPVGFDKPQIA